MILYIKSLGFSAFDSKKKAEKLVQEVMKEPTQRYISNYKDEKLKVEYYKEYGEDFGLVVRGELDEKEEITVHTIIPYAKGEILTTSHEIDVIGQENIYSFSGYCDEEVSGTPISFYLQNVVDYQEIEEEENVYVKGVYLTGFSVEGTVVLPIEKDEEDVELENAEQLLREELLKQARDGDEDAMDALEEEAIEASRVLRERLKSEDILSILEGFFIPIDDDDDVYSVLGTIETVKQLKNSMTGEKVYKLGVQCMNILVEMYINEDDLVGQPLVGMRFKGTTWVHGTIEFALGHEE